MNKWPVEQGEDFTVGLLGKVEGNKGLAWSLGCPGSLTPHQILCPIVWLDTQLSHGHLTSLYLPQSGELSPTVSMSGSVLPVPRGLPHKLLCLAKSSDTRLSLQDNQALLPEVTGMEEANGEGETFPLNSDWLSGLFVSVTVSPTVPLNSTEGRDWQGRHHLVTI